MFYWCNYHNRKVNSNKAKNYCKKIKDCESLKPVKNKKKFYKLKNKQESYIPLTNWKGKYDEKT